MPSQSIVRVFPGCPYNVLNNSLWLEFVADTQYIHLRIIPSNCPGTNGPFGMQAAILGNCQGDPLATQCNCTTDTIDLISDKFEKGHLYYLVIDGCAGDRCDYEVTVVAGKTGLPYPTPPLPPMSIAGEETPCLGGVFNYKVEYEEPAVFEWYTIPSTAATITSLPGSDKASIQWLEEGPVELCVEVGGYCTSPPSPVCRTINVELSVGTSIDSMTLCQGECFTLPNGELACEAGQYVVILSGQATCDSVAVFRVEVIPRPTTILPPVVLCHESHYTLSDTIVLDSSDTYSLLLPTGEPCDSLVILALTFLRPEAVLTPPPMPLCLENNQGIIWANNSTISKGSGIARNFVWEGPPGGIIASDSLSAQVVAPGTYCLTITEEKLGVSCSSTDCVEVEAKALSLPAFVEICTGEAIELDATTPGVSLYFWAVGAQGPVLLVNEPGVYEVSGVGANLCVYHGQTEVQVVDQLDPGLPDSLVICENGSAVLTPKSGYAHYLWNSTIEMANLTVSNPGLYLLEVTSAGGCQGTDSTLVFESPAPPTGLPSVINACLNDLPVLLEGTPGMAAYRWSTGDTTQTTLATEPNLYTLEVTDSIGCTSFGSVELNIQPFPDSLLADTSTFCIYDFPATITIPDVFAIYQWSTGDTTNSAVFEQAGAYSLIVTDTSGCALQKSGVVQAIEGPDALLSDLYQLCPEALPFTLEPAGQFESYLWNTQSTSATIQALVPGVYSLTVLDSYGCTWADSTSVSIFPAPTVFEDSLLALCPENLPYFIHLPGFVEYLWPDGSTADWFEIKSSMVLIPWVIDSNGCHLSDTLLVETNPSPIVTISPDTASVCFEDLQLELDAGAGFASYLWSLGFSTQTVTLTPSVILVPGDYAIWVTVTNEFDCAGADTTHINVELCNATAESSLPGVLTVAPNPSEGHLKLVYEGLLPGDYSLRLLSPNGIVVHEQSAPITHSDGQIILLPRQLPAGTYFLRVASQWGTATLRVIVQ